jgi:DNA repair exonuclease SbcCD ATPase subunit
MMRSPCWAAIAIALLSLAVILRVPAHAYNFANPMSRDAAHYCAGSISRKLIHRGKDPPYLLVLSMTASSMDNRSSSPPSSSAPSHMPPNSDTATSSLLFTFLQDKVKQREQRAAAGDGAAKAADDARQNTREVLERLAEALRVRRAGGSNDASFLVELQGGLGRVEAALGQVSNAIRRESSESIRLQAALSSLREEREQFLAERDEELDQVEAATSRVASSHRKVVEAQSQAAAAARRAHVAEEERSAAVLKLAEFQQAAASGTSVIDSKELSSHQLRREFEGQLAGLQRKLKEDRLAFERAEAKGKQAQATLSQQLVELEARLDATTQLEEQRKKGLEACLVEVEQSLAATKSPSSVSDGIRQSLKKARSELRRGNGWRRTAPAYGALDSQLALLRKQAEEASDLRTQLEHTKAKSDELQASVADIGKQLSNATEQLERAWTKLEAETQAKDAALRDCSIAVQEKRHLQDRLNRQTKVYEDTVARFQKDLQSGRKAYEQELARKMGDDETFVEQIAELPRLRQEVDALRAQLKVKEGKTRGGEEDLRESLRRSEVYIRDLEARLASLGASIPPLRSHRHGQAGGSPPPARAQKATGRDLSTQSNPPQRAASHQELRRPQAALKKPSVPAAAADPPKTGASDPRRLNEGDFAGLGG